MNETLIQHRFINAQGLAEAIKTMNYNFDVPSDMFLVDADGFYLSTVTLIRRTNPDGSTVYKIELSGGKP